MPRSNDPRLAAAVALLALALACAGGGDDATSGGPGDGPPATTGPETAALFCDTLYDTFAQRWADCSKAPLAWATQFIVKEKLCAGLVYAVSAGTATYDAADAGACLAFFGSASCSDLRGVRDGVKYVAACHAAVTGTAVPAYPYTYCGSDYECASGRCVGGAGGGCPGYCYSGQRVGGSCSNDRDCAAGLYCHSPGYTCQEYSHIPGEGQSCNFTVGCQPGLYCDAYFGGACRPQISAGACPNISRAMAPGHGCFDGAAAPLLGAGDTCNPWASRCGPGLYCSSGYVCTQQPSAGEPCASAAGVWQGCIGGYCGMSTFRCVESLPDPCYSDWDCASRGYCVNGKCEGYCS